MNELSSLEDRIMRQAEGSDNAEAAAIILIHALDGRLLGKLSSAIRDDPSSGMAWVDWDIATKRTQPFSPSERKLVDLAASFATDLPIIASDTFTGLDPVNSSVVLDAVARCLGGRSMAELIG